ncbi:hypothetical protein [Endothiovibrio diazotrophicus]
MSDPACLATPSPLSGDDATTIETLLELRRELTPLHHVPGRIRLRLGFGLVRLLPRFNGASPEGWLGRLPGILDVRFNPAAASVVIEYDPRQVPPESWNRLIEGDDRDAKATARSLLGRA